MNFKSFKNPIDANTRDEILKHAQSIFAEVGFKEATIRQICKKAKTNVCLVSYYFGGKEGLYKAVFEKIMNDKSFEVKKNLGTFTQIENKEEYKMRMQFFLEEMFASHLRDTSVFQLLHREITEGLPRVQDIISKYLNESRDAFVHFIEMGQKKKFVKKNLDPFLATSAAINMIMGFVNHFTIAEKNEFLIPHYNRKELPEKMIKTITSIYIDGVIQHENAK